MTIAEIVNKINVFLKSTRTNLKMTFKEGYYLHLKKRTQGDKQFIEIHTPGYDDTLQAAEAVDWIQWEIYDRSANGFI